MALSRRIDCSFMYKQLLIHVQAIALTCKSNEHNVPCFVKQARERCKAAARLFSRTVLHPDTICIVLAKIFARFVCHMGIYHYICNELEANVPFSKICLLNFPAELRPRKGFHEQNLYTIEAVL